MKNENRYWRKSGVYKERDGAIDGRRLPGRPLSRKVVFC